MEKKYIIRKNAFHYSDEHHYFHAMGVVTGKVYHDAEKANQDLISLEREAYLTADLGDFAPFAGTSSRVDMDKMIQLKHYLERIPGLETLISTDPNGRMFVQPYTRLPETLTTEQVRKIRYLSGLHFYELFPFTGVPQFYGVWKKKPFFRNEGFVESEGSAYFYNSYLEAFQSAISHSPDHGGKVEIRGELSEITDMPRILTSLIKTSASLSYEHDEKKLIFQGLYNQEWASLCTLLRSKPFEIKLLSLDQVKQFNHRDYESM